MLRVGRLLLSLFILSLPAFTQEPPRTPPPSASTPVVLPAAQVGTPYSQALTSGSPPVSWILVSGTLPAGLSIDGSTGVISGTPSVISTSVFTVSAARESRRASLRVSLTVNGPPKPTPLNITTASPLPAAQTGRTYSQILTASGSGLITWSIASALPAGLSLNSSTGVLAGTPSTPGTYSFSVLATSPYSNASAELSLTVYAVPSITTVSPLQAGQTGLYYSETLAASGSTPLTWAVSSGALPSGLSLNISSGVLSGTPTASGTATFTVTAANTYGNSSRQFILTVNAAPTITTISPLMSAVAGTAYAQTLSASGTTPITWAVSSGILPPGLALNPSTGALTGTPSASVSALFTVTATNAFGSNSAQFSLKVSSVVSVSVNPATASLTISQTQQFSATVTGNSNTAVTWSVSPSVGTISNTGLYAAPASIARAQNVTVTAVSAADSTKSATATITLTPVAVSLTPPSVSLQPSQSQTFSVSVSGTTNTAVTWSLSQSLGSYASSATSLIYIAPGTAATAQTVTITATSSADPTKTAAAVITLPQTTTVSVSPTTINLSSSGTQQFTATAVGNGNAAITWSINPSIGTISTSGLYTAPSSIATSQTVTVKAASVASPTSSASATIVLNPPSPPSAPAYTYYVDSTNGSDSNPGTLAAPWKTVAKVNSTMLLPGQSVAFKAGDLWREQLTVFNGGSVGTPVTFTFYGSGPAPIISGADVLTSWTSTPPYYSDYVTAPTQIFRNGTRLTQVSTQSALVTGSWWLDTAASRIYVYDNPNGNTMEASQRTYGVEIGVSYVTVNGLTLTEANKEGVGIFTGSNYVTVANCNISNSYSNGIAVWSASPSISNGVIQNNTISDSGGNGINIEQNATYWTIQNNTVYGNSTNPAVNAYTAGIDIGSSSVSNITVERNNVYSNGLGQPTNIGFGIHVDVQSPNNVIRGNSVNGNNDCNILVEISENNQIYGNVVYGSIQGCGIGIRGAAGTPASGNVVYNNTIYGNLANQNWAGGLLAYGDGSPASFVNNTFENNVSVGNGSHQLNAFGGAENDGTNGYGNTYVHNDFGQDATNFIHWGSSVYYSTLTTWQVASNQGYNLDVNPLFANPNIGDFILQSGSPLIGAGIYIPGVSTTNPPNIGAM